MIMKFANYIDFLNQRTTKTTQLILPGIGSVDIHELSAAESWEIDCKARELKGDERELYVVRAAARMLKGSEPTKKEMELLRKNHSAGVIGKIYHTGLSLNLAEDVSDGDIEKN